jgi:hypothetical protein
MTRVSTIIVNHNGKGITIDCLAALKKQSLKDFEGIIVDNGSSDGSLFEIQRFTKETPIALRVELVSLKRNLGFAGGSLEGLRYANGEFIAILNNDTEADERWIEELVKVMDSDSAVGVCASKLIASGTNMINSAWDAYSTSLKGFKRGEGGVLSLFDRVKYVFGACAGAALDRRKMIEEIGFLDEDFFLIY